MGRISVVALVVVLAVVAAVSTASARPSGGTINLVAYSTPREAYAKLIPAFRTRAPARTRRSSSPTAPRASRPAPSIAGLKADVVAFSLEPDMTKLVEPGLVAQNWNEEPLQGHGHALGRRLRRPQGQPEGDRDLGRPGQARRRGRHAEPVQTSGGAKVEHHGRLRRAAQAGKTHAQAVAYLEKLYKHIVSQDKSAREALQTFLARQGDVLLAYENEAIFAQQKDQAIDYVIPKPTILIENPIAVVKTSSNKATGQRVRRLPAHDAGAEDLRARTATGRSLQSAAKEFAFPIPTGAVHDQVARRLGEGRQAVLRPATAGS